MRFTSRSWVDYIPRELQVADSDSVSVDMGCGRLPRNPMRAAKVIGVDVMDSPPFEESSESRYLRVDPLHPLPIANDSANFVTAFDFIEHIPRFHFSGGKVTNPFIDIMNEIYRILKVDGLFIALTPCFPSSAAFVDPTHVNYISTETVDYFSGPSFARSLGYGFHGNFEKLESMWVPSTGPLWSSYTINVEQGRKIPSLKSKVKNLLVATLKPSSGWRYTHYLWVLRKQL